MDTKEVKAQIHKTVDRVEEGVEAAATHVSNGAGLLNDAGNEVLETFRELGRRMLESSKALTEQANRQARLHPFAVLGCAFVAGVVVARALRR